MSDDTMNPAGDMPAADAPTEGAPEAAPTPEGGTEGEAAA